jgi:hypothetical protein
MHSSLVEKAKYCKSLASIHQVCFVMEFGRTPKVKERCFGLDWIVKMLCSFRSYFIAKAILHACSKRTPMQWICYAGVHSSSLVQMTGSQPIPVRMGVSRLFSVSCRQQCHASARTPPSMSVNIKLQWKRGQLRFEWEHRRQHKTLPPHPEPSSTTSLNANRGSVMFSAERT